jgi:hypothetical protein
LTSSTNNKNWLWSQSSSFYASFFSVSLVNWNHSHCIIYLVVPQETDAINCYICDSGTDGCGPSFKKTGSGVVITSSSISTYFMVSIYWYSRNISPYSFICRLRHVPTPILASSVGVEYRVLSRRIGIEMLVLVVLMVSWDRGIDRYWYCSVLGIGIVARQVSVVVSKYRFQK